MSFVPLRMRPLGDEQVLCVHDTGRFFTTTSPFLERFAADELSPFDHRFLIEEGHALAPDDALGHAGYLYGLAERAAHAGPLDYLILVPTLRCNLSCSYCQVSRAGLKQPGFDWSDETLGAVLTILDELPGDRIKIELQGGEPTLRPDLIRAVIERCQRFEERQFVICTNLQQIDDNILALFDNPELYISTSLDGDALTHQRHRTGSNSATDQFLANLRFVLARYGPHKVSALPTVDPRNPPEIDTLIDTYAALGFDSIFLRPINYQGFARKRHSDSREQSETWRAYHERFVRALIARNWSDRSRVLEESYTGICLRRIFQPGVDRHVDLRNPNPLGHDYVVIDHDGLVYPTDEARMLSRSGVIDLAIGDVQTGWAGTRRDLLNAHNSNYDDPACQRCAYQPYCGRDLVDDLARYGRIDRPRLETEFCRRHLHLFDFLFSLIYEDDPAVRYSLSRWLRLDGTPQAFGVAHA
ncbi:His-Xaa-Ser system radical SAM maturase HxsB [Sphingomonas sp. HF-S4]|uniref:His-Xaa-Ser system radical SAM maturase HxsB n=1 Tax=Sphingomonas agrestis TaxID=3080540 RepID=A0ABU3Y364_9SPHN|nr:His-Xaa-Ser system radical SAM maturase HxsB [Sphingomonas sp. HF-S4]MDV3455835.1 His-Xaa-Ser system radical SAM maturase HxsB [Sphingomonas sp. HF-S4]